MEPVKRYQVNRYQLKSIYVPEADDVLAVLASDHDTAMRERDERIAALEAKLAAIMRKP